MSVYLVLNSLPHLEHDEVINRAGRHSYPDLCTLPGKWPLRDDFNLDSFTWQFSHMMNIFWLPFLDIRPSMSWFQVGGIDGLIDRGSVRLPALDQVPIIVFCLASYKEGK
ncbi:hypothetical protein P167DRAFT_545982 [Morchella conica CCBAS932]|uniref:Uncharacterized protein n=1 Tax=Morchella conica CCBAS932 TaxID=1392247 RepID=A0A3N4L1V9_9PEZI|nr:hypothetical protein P167DRAFT_545982 [Morchella conica CCBAS932]